MIRFYTTKIVSVILLALSVNAQEMATSNDSYELDNSLKSSASESDEPAQEAAPSSSVITSPIISDLTETTSDDAVEDNEKSKSKKGIAKSLTKLRLNASVEMQIDKELYNEFGTSTDSRFVPTQIRNYRKAVDDFWLRIGLKGSYSAKYLESVFSVRFYPYWAMRRKANFENGGDLEKFLDLTEISQAYLKVFKQYGADEKTFTMHFKAGRDGMQNPSSYLFGNFLDIATGGYGETRYQNFTGPFKNRKVISNQLEIGTDLKTGTFFSSKFSAMFGANLNTEKWYNPSVGLFQEMDSKLSAGFYRFFLDLYFFNERLHLCSGFRNYFVKKYDEIKLSFETDHLPTANWAFDVLIIPNLKFYSEFGFQKIGIPESKSIIRPVSMGVTIPTGKVLDILAIEFENVASTFFSDECMRDRVGGGDIRAFAWGMTAEKTFAQIVTVAWGLYPGDQKGDLKTSLRLSANY